MVITNWEKGDFYFGDFWFYFSIRTWNAIIYKFDIAYRSLIEFESTLVWNFISVLKNEGSR